MPTREYLPNTRLSLIHKFEVGGQEGYIIVGQYPDGRPGEIFIEIQKEGSTMGGLCDCFGIAISIMLQHGIPLELLIKKFRHQKFLPAGITSNPNIPMADSIIDYLFQWLALTYCKNERE